MRESTVPNTSEPADPPTPESHVNPRFFGTTISIDFLIFTSVIALLPIITYHEERAGDDDSVGKWMEHTFGRLLFPSTFGFVVAELLFLVIISAALCQIQPRILVILSIKGTLAGGIVTLLFDGIVKSLNKVSISLFAGAIFCRICNGVAWLWKRNSCKKLPVLNDEEQALITTTTK